MTDPALLHTSVLCFAVLSCSDLASSSSRQPLTSLTASPPASEWPHLRSFWTHEDVKDPNSLKTRHGFTGGLVSFRHVFMYSGLCCYQRLNKYLYWRSHQAKLFGLYRCQRLNYINTTLPLALSCTNLWMWKYFAVLHGHVHWVQVPTTKARQKSLSCVTNHGHPLASKYLPP